MADNRARNLRRSLFTAVSALALSLLASAPVALAASQSTAGTHKTQGTSGTSGSTSQPQPTSNADQNSGGANGQCPGGPYCSTRDGSASGNGNGGGKATGKPCAGCVGKADNKNPQGQKPNGSDHNAGYECDRNHGIGRSNPAHTGCTTPPTTGGGGGSDCTTNPTAAGCMSGGGTDCTTNPTAAGCMSGGGTDCTTNPTAAGCTTPGTGPGGGGGNACVPSAANGFCSSVLGEKQTVPPTAQVPTTQVPSAKVLSESVTQPPAATTTQLPMTGADVVPLMAAGLGALTAGALLMVSAARRRRPASHQHSES